MKKENSKKHPILRGILKFFLAIIILVVLFIGGFIGYSTYKNGWGLKGIIKTAVGSEVKTPQELGEFRTLVLGVSEDISTPLTDTIMIASYNPSTQKATLLSIPRDTYVGKNKSRANSYDKINAIYQKDGAEGTLEKVNELTGLNIKNYVVISNNALIELVDEIGGVEFDVPMDMKYTSERQGLYINLKKGLQKLDGKQAEGLVRFRKSNNNKTYSSEYGSDDFGRMRTQREFIKAVAEQTLKAKNITKIGNLIDIVKKNVKTNINDWSQIKEYIPYAVDFDTDNIQSENIPGDSARIPAGTGLWFFLADEVQTKSLVKELFENEKKSEVDDETNTSNTINSNSTQSSTAKTTTNSKTETNNTTKKENSKIKIEVLNGTGDSSALKSATELLKEEGYTVYKTDKTSTTQVTTIINRAKLSENVTKDIKSVLKTGVVSSSSSSSKVDITIILGKDFIK